MEGSRELAALSKAREPWPGTCVCHWHGVSLLCLALTPGPSVVSGCPSALWNSWDAGMSICEFCSLCLNAPGEGFGRGWLHPHWAQRLLSLQAASLCLSHPQVPHIAVGMTAGLGYNLWNSIRVIWGRSCGAPSGLSLLLVYFWSHIITKRGKKLNSSAREGAARVFLSAAAPLMTRRFCFVLALLTTPGCLPCPG